MSIEDAEIKDRSDMDKVIDAAVHKHFVTNTPTSTKFKLTDEDQDDEMTIRHSRKILWRGGVNDYLRSLDRLQRELSPDTQHD